MLFVMSYGFASFKELRYTRYFIAFSVQKMLLLTILSYMAFGSHESRAEKNSEPAANEDKSKLFNP